MLNNCTAEFLDVSAKVFRAAAGNKPETERHQTTETSLIVTSRAACLRIKMFSLEDVKTGNR